MEDLNSLVFGVILALVLVIVALGLFTFVILNEKKSIFYPRPVDLPYIATPGWPERVFNSGLYPGDPNPSTVNAGAWA